jgi:hexosaminidase
MVCLVTLSLLSLLVPTLALWPAPRSLSSGNSTLRLSNSFAISAGFHAPPDLQNAISRTTNFLRKDALAPLVTDRGASLVSGARRARQIGSLRLSLSRGAKANSISTEAIKAIEERDESYALNVPGDGSAATLVANTTLGLFRGLTTFSQLWYTVDGTVFLQNAPVAITDEPAFVSVMRIRSNWMALTELDSLSEGSCWTLREICEQTTFLMNRGKDLTEYKQLPCI